MEKSVFANAMADTVRSDGNISSRHLGRPVMRSRRIDDFKGRVINKKSSCWKKSRLSLKRFTNGSNLNRLTMVLTGSIVKQLFF